LWQGFFGQNRILRDGLDLEHAPVGLKPDLAECGQVVKTLADIEAARVVLCNGTARRASRIIVGMLSEIFHWFVSLTEVLAVIATILLAGLVLALGAFRVLARIAAALAGLDPDSGAIEDETGDYFVGDGFADERDDSSREKPVVREH